MFSVWATWIKFLQVIASNFTIQIHLLFIYTKDMPWKDNSYVLKITETGYNYPVY